MFTLLLCSDDDMQSTYSHVPDFNDDPVMEQDSDEEETADNEDVKATGNGQVHNCECCVCACDCGLKSNFKRTQ